MPPMSHHYCGDIEKLKHPFPHWVANHSKGIVKSVMVYRTEAKLMLALHLDKVKAPLTEVGR